MRRRAAYTEAKDSRELILMAGRLVSVQEYKLRVSEHTMAAFDNLPPEWRALIHEYGNQAAQLSTERRRLTAKDAHEMLEKWSKL